MLMNVLKNEHFNQCMNWFYWIFFQVCDDIELPIKIIVDVEQCDQITRTVCTESITEIPQEVCVYEYVKKYEETVAKTVEVNYVKETNVQMVTVCSGGHRGYGHHAPVHHAPIHHAPIHHAPHHGFTNHGAHLGHAPHFVGKREAEVGKNSEKIQIFFEYQYQLKM